MPATATTADQPHSTAAQELFDKAKSLVLESGKPSISWLQRNMRIGYHQAAALMELLELEGVVSAPDHLSRRTILTPADRSDDALVTLAKDLHAAGARATIGADGSAQISIPVDLPEQHRSPDDRLRLLIERIERLEEEKKGLGDDIRDVYIEAKATGYDAKIMRQIIRLRKMKPDDRREMEAILDTYKNALGLD